MSKSVEVCKLTEWLGSRKLLDNLEREERVADTDIGESRWNSCVVISTCRREDQELGLRPKRARKCFGERRSYMF